MAATCENCGRPFSAPMRREPGPYCDRYCRNEAIAGHPIKNCKGCREAFSLKGRGDFNRDYCSTTCAYKTQKPLGRNPDTLRREKAWEGAVKRRDGRTCRFPHDLVPGIRCEAPLDAHHVFPKDVWPMLKFDPDIGLTVCRPSHRWIETNHSEAAKLGLRLTRKDVANGLEPIRLLPAS